MKTIGAKNRDSSMISLFNSGRACPVGGILGVMPEQIVSAGLRAMMGSDMTEEGGV
ncbi:hypothetical protein ACSAZL_15210 [Methanosarcina sp. T3]|uniref:hypothetical protein n=1 Tax=Methanosarcina sp. T3 TaxID=3439062 RepID=UPI003F853265